MKHDTPEGGRATWNRRFFRAAMLLDGYLTGNY
jgi:hypothetical protein